MVEAAYLLSRLFVSRSVNPKDAAPPPLTVPKPRLLLFLAYPRGVRVPPHGGGTVYPAHVSVGLQGLQDACAGVHTPLASLTPT